jgi:hypothetical protein
VKANDEGEQDHGERSDPRERRQRVRTDQGRHELGREPAHQRGPEDDPDQDLDHSERQRMAQAGDPPEGDRQGEDGESLNEEDRGGRDGRLLF